MVKRVLRVSASSLEMKNRPPIYLDMWNQGPIDTALYSGRTETSRRLLYTRIALTTELQKVATIILDVAVSNCANIVPLYIKMFMT
jgi:hypothetical protein